MATGISEGKSSLESVLKPTADRDYPAESPGCPGPNLFGLPIVLSTAFNFLKFADAQDFPVSRTDTGDEMAKEIHGFECQTSNQLKCLLKNAMVRSHASAAFSSS